MKIEELDKYKVKCVLPANGKEKTYQSGTGDYLLSQHKEDLLELFEINENPDIDAVREYLENKGFVFEKINTIDN